MVRVIVVFSMLLAPLYCWSEEAPTTHRQLGEVVVDGVSAHVLEPEKQTLHIDKDPISQGGTLSQSMLTVPSLQVGIEGNLRLQGSEKIQILLDGARNGWMGAERGDVLNSLPNSIVQTLEVYTHPVATFMPDGAGGIINIVTDKPNDQPYHLTVGLDYGLHNRMGGMIRGGYLGKGWRLSGYYAGRNDYRYRSFSTETTNLNSDQSVLSTESQNNSATARPQTHYAHLQAEYTFNPRHTLLVSGNFRYVGYDRKGDISMTKRKAAGDTLLLFDKDRLNFQQQYTWDVTAKYTMRFKRPNHQLAMVATFHQYIRKENNIYITDTIMPRPAHFVDQVSMASEQDMVGLKADYQLPLPGDAYLKAGYYGVVFWSDNRHFFADSTVTGGWQEQKQKSFEYRYLTQRHLLYASYDQTFLRQLSLHAGIRGEYCYQLGQVRHVMQNPEFNPVHDFKIYPTLQLSWSPTVAHKLYIYYGMRVDRPSAKQLNPYLNKENPNLWISGNTDLKPELIHNLSLGYHYKSRVVELLPSVFYRYTTDWIGSYYYQDQGKTIQTLANFDALSTIGGAINMAIRPVKWMDINLAFWAGFREMDGSNKDNIGDVVRSFDWESKGDVNFQITPTTRLQVSGGYLSAQTTLQGTLSGRWRIDAAATQQVFKKKGLITLSVNDIGDGLGEITTLHLAGKQQVTYRYRDPLVLMVGFRYSL